MSTINTPSDWDDVLARTGNESSAVTRGEQIARERARRDAPEAFCGMCTDPTPLAMESARDVHTVKHIRKTAQAVHQRLVQLDGRDLDEIQADEENLGFEDLWWIKDALVEAYRQAFYEACVEPSECEICTNPEAFDRCGHLETGDSCPARPDSEP